MPLPLILGAIARFVIPVVGFWLADKALSLVDKDEITNETDQFKDIFKSVEGITDQEANEAKLLLESLPNPTWSGDPAMTAGFIGALATAPKIERKIAGAQSPEIKKIFLKIKDLETKLRGKSKITPGVGGILSKFTSLLFLMFVLEQTGEWLVGWGTKHVNRFLEWSGLPSSFRLPEPIGTYIPPGFKTENWEPVFRAMQDRGVNGLTNPETGLTMDFTPEKLADVATHVYFDRAAAGLSAFPNDVLLQMEQYLLPASVRKTELVGERIVIAETKREPITRIYQKPKLFLGTIFAGRIGPLSQFKRRLDDLITDDKDLLEGAEINLARWLEAMPGLLTFRIDVKLNPFDENNVVLPGTWAVMTISVNNRFSKSLPLDEVILGPIKPEVYYPEYQRVVEVIGKLPEFAKYAPIEAAEIIKVETKPGVFTPVAGLTLPSTPAIPAEQAVSTTPVSTPTPAPALVSPPSPTIPTPPVIDGLVYTPAESADSIAIAKKYGMSLSQFLDLNPELKSRQPTIGERVNLAIPEVIKIAVDRGAGILTALKIYQESKAPALEELTEFKPGIKGVAIPERLVSVSVPVVLVRAEPNTASPLAGSERLSKGTTFKVIGWVKGQNVDGEDRWWVSQFKNFVWVGGTNEKP